MFIQAVSVGGRFGGAVSGMGANKADFVSSGHINHGRCRHVKRVALGRTLK